MKKVKALPKGKLQLIVWENGSVEIADIKAMKTVKVWEKPSKAMRHKITSLTYRDDFNTNAIFCLRSMAVFISRKSYNW